MYSILKNILFLLPPEKAHHFSMNAFQDLLRLPGMKQMMENMLTLKHPSLEKELFGLKFPNPIGLAAGFDKDARYLDALSVMGFGFVEIGTLTPKPQPGNDAPRLFRLPADKALINRLGFNNLGVDVAAHRLKNRPKGLIVGGNIGKNKLTSYEEAVWGY